MEVHPLSSPRDPAVVIPLLGVPFSPSGGLGNVSVRGQSTAETLEQLYARYHPTASALLTSPTNVSSLRLSVQSPVFAQQALVLQGGGVSVPFPQIPLVEQLAANPQPRVFPLPAPLNVPEIPHQPEPTSPEREEEDEPMGETGALVPRTASGWEEWRDREIWDYTK